MSPVAGTPLLQTQALSRRFEQRAAPRRGLGRGSVDAVTDVSIELHEGEALALVGESGAGKTTLARCVVRLLDASAGTVRFRGADVTRARGNELHGLRAETQMVFQHPHASLNPRKRVRQTLAATLTLQGVPRERRPDAIREALRSVGLDAGHAERYPHELSGGERQRVAIARALSGSPRAIVLDEPVSALDTRVQSQVLDLLAELRDKLGLAYLLISHDLGVVRRLADRVAVMCRGRLVETGSTAEVLERPSDPYTRELVTAAPRRRPAVGAAVRAGATRP